MDVLRRDRQKRFTSESAALGMWYITEEMRRSILDVAREVFSDQC